MYFSKITLILSLSKNQKCGDTYLQIARFCGLNRALCIYEYIGGLSNSKVSNLES